MIDCSGSGSGSGNVGGGGGGSWLFANARTFCPASEREVMALEVIVPCRHVFSYLQADNHIHEHQTRNSLRCLQWNTDAKTRTHESTQEAPPPTTYSKIVTTHRAPWIWPGPVLAHVASFGYVNQTCNHVGTFRVWNRRIGEDSVAGFLWLISPKRVVGDARHLGDRITLGDIRINWNSRVLKIQIKASSETQQSYCLVSTIA